MNKMGYVSKCTGSLLVIFAVIFSMFAVNVQAAEKTFPSGLKADELGKTVESIAKETSCVSAAVAVFSGDNVYTEFYGNADNENKIAADEDTVYEWGSVSKTMIWVSAMQLYEQGKLDLNEDVRKYLPQGFFKHLKYDMPITMLDLMNHKGGWQETIYTIQVKDENEIMPLGEALQYSEPLQVFKPGTVSAYSNWGAALAGYVIECITGMKYGDYVRENIFKPLGMEHTSIMPDHKDNEWVRTQREKLKSYSKNFEDSSIKSLGTNMTFINLYPAGAATGTIGDMKIYAQALVNDNSSLFSKKETFDELFSGSDFYNNGKNPAVCHGFFVMNRGIDTIEHSGATDACSSNLAIDRKSKTGLVVLTNMVGSGSFYNKITESVFGKTADNPIFDKKKLSESADLSGMYSISRGFFGGQQKIFSMDNILPISKISESEYTIGRQISINQIDDGLYKLEQGEELYLVSIDSDETIGKILHIGGVDYIERPNFNTEMAMVICYVILAVLSVVFLFVELIVLLVRISKKIRKHFAGDILITLAQIAKPLSVLTAAVMIGMTDCPRMYGYVFGITQLVFMIIYAVTAVMSIIFLFSRQESKWRYILSLLSNAYGIAFILTFELWWFWV